MLLFAFVRRLFACGKKNGGFTIAASVNREKGSALTMEAVWFVNVVGLDKHIIYS